MYSRVNRLQHLETLAKPLPKFFPMVNHHLGCLFLVLFEERFRKPCLGVRATGYPVFLGGHESSSLCLSSPMPPARMASACPLTVLPGMEVLMSSILTGSWLVRVLQSANRGDPWRTAGSHLGKEL